MPRRHTVETLPQEQREFVLDRFLDGDDPRRISLAFEDKFNTKLAKSSIDRWVDAVAIPLAEQYRVQRAIARELAKQIAQGEGADKHQLIIENIEDHLLSSLHEVVKTDSYKLLLVQQTEKDRQLKEKTLALKERAQAFQEEQARKADELQHDRLRIGADTWQFILSFLLGKEPQAADLLTKHSEEILNGLETHLDQTA